MSGFIGKYGRLVEIARHAGTIGETHERPTRYLSLLGGGRSAQVGLRSLRTWNVSLPHAEVSDVAAVFENIVTASTPLIFISPSAQRVNLLTPSQSLIANDEYSVGAFTPSEGLMVATDGAQISRWLTNIGATTQFYSPVRDQAGVWNPTPVIPGRPVTFSGYVSSDVAPKIVVTWVDSVNTPVGVSVTTSFAVPGPSLHRVSVTLTPPDGVAAAQLNFQGFQVVARPAVTWTGSVMPWSVGRGALSVWVEVSSTSDLVLGSGLSSFDFTIRELYSAAG